MAADLIQFVDSIDASPAVRLDLNDDNPWRCPRFVHTPAPLRRAEGQNAMTNGGFVSSSAYGWSKVSMTLDLSGTQDAQATQMQLLARELDRSDNFLMYQPNGLTKPVFFLVKRSNMTDVEDKEAQTPKRRIQVDLLCEPFAVGLRETLGPYTVNNDPAAGSNGHYFDVTGVIGDVMTPCILVDTGTRGTGGMLAVRQHGTPSDTTVWYTFQAEDDSGLNDTTNPGGGPDAAMSGTDTNNYLRTTFATVPTLASRVNYFPTTNDAEKVALRGQFRIYAVVRRSDNTSVITAQAIASPTSSTGPLVTIPKNVGRQIIDLGVVSFDAGTPTTLGYDTVSHPIFTPGLTLMAARASGAGTLDWDYVLVIPADECTMHWSELANDTEELIIDGYAEAVYLSTNGVDPFGSTARFYGTARVAGGFPNLVPSRTNRVFYATYGASVSGEIDKADVGAVTLHYWPQYLSIRPAAS